MVEERRRKPFEGDSEWGRRMEQRHLDNLARFDKIEDDMSKSDADRKEDMNRINTHMALDLAEHTAMRALTESVKTDTGPLRATGIRVNRLCDEWFGLPESSQGAKDGKDGIGRQIEKLLAL